MPFAPLIAAGRRWQETTIPTEHAGLAWAALQRLRAAFPDDARKGRSLVEFAAAIREVKDVPGRMDDMEVLNLVLGGGKVSADMRRMMVAMDSLSEPQKVRLEALQDAHLHAMSEFFADLGIKDLFLGSKDHVHEPMQHITDINGIGEATARHLAQLHVRDLSDLAKMSDAKLAEVEAHIPHRPGGGPSAWREEAKALLAEH